MQIVLLWLCVSFLFGCSSVVNTHPHNAIPIKAGKFQANGGYATASNVYKMHNYIPAFADSTVQERMTYMQNVQSPLGYNIGLGKGYAIGGQLAACIGPKFRGSTYYAYFSDIPSIKPTKVFGYYAKVHLQKSFPLGQDTFIAIFPAIGTGEGVATIAYRSIFRFNHNSVELPITISHRHEFDSGRQLILSLTGRIAYDRIDGDLRIITTEGMEYIFNYYYNQPQLKASRNAIMGHMDFLRKDNVCVRLQLGAEHVQVNKAESWEPIVYLGLGYNYK